MIVDCRGSAKDANPKSSDPIKIIINNCSEAFFEFVRNESDSRTGSHELPSLTSTLDVIHEFAQSLYIVCTSVDGSLELRTLSL